MSATGRKKQGERGERGGGASEFFETPAAAVHAFLDHPACPLQQAPDNGIWLEPCAGEGAIVRAIQSYEHLSYNDAGWAVAEIRPECLPALEALPNLVAPPAICDFLADEGTERIFDFAIFNPPFSKAMEFLQACLKRARTVVMLQRVGFLEGEDRNGFLRRCPPDLFVLTSRPSFDSRGSDAACYGWYVWRSEELERRSGALHILEWKSKKIEKPKKEAEQKISKREHASAGVKLVKTDRAEARPMMVMMSNASGTTVGHLAATNPDRIGHLYSPGGERGPWQYIPYALDNGAYVAFKNGKPWDETAWLRLLDWAKASGQDPLWCIVPDVVQDRAGTIERWTSYVDRVRERGWIPAFAVQDGMAFDDVPSDDCVIFLGGSTEWKDEAIVPWCGRFPGRVHVGRVNRWERLVRCWRAGAVSVDGTGWYHKSKRSDQLGELVRFLEETRIP